MRPSHIAIVGAGFTGTALAAHLLDTLTHPATISLIEATGEFGTGLAYGTRHPGHLMNTPSGVIGAVLGQREDFAAWLNRHPGETAEDGGFARRSAYGQYLRDLLENAARRSDVGLARVTATVIGVTERRDGYHLQLASGRIIDADQVVLCTGYGTPAAAAPARRVVDNPWSEGWVDRVAPDDAVIFKGSGLTMVDQVLRLRSSGHRGALLAVSRHGLLPLGHSDPLTAPTAPTIRIDTSLSGLLRQVRALARQKRDWRAGFDGLRSLNQQLWRGFSPAERSRFDRHLRAYWNIHRHRMAPSVAKAIAELRSESVLEVRAGSVSRVTEAVGGVTAQVRKRGSGVTEPLRAGWLVDCSRPGRGAGPLEWSLLAAGLGHLAGSEIVTSTDANGCVLADDGSVAEGLYCLGPPSRAELGEITAIPEIREQVGRAAAAIERSLTVVGPRSPTAGRRPALPTAARFQ